MNKELLLNDIIFSPLSWHVALLLISSVKAITLKLVSRHNEAQGWDVMVSMLLFINPFLAYFADSFWSIWLQSFILGLPFYLLGFHFRTHILRIDQYSDSAAAVMFSGFMFLIGHVLSGGFLFIRYLWRSFWQ
ncbi:MAG: hypothetical protein B0W54_15640 [Cellvibrio sp. 79]|nr:MAG: hypothetical protein B0W54_15640 [Cellvibrio sp. 79]